MADFAGIFLIIMGSPAELPMELKFKQAFNSREEAVAREKQIKAWKSKRMIEKLISDL